MDSTVKPPIIRKDGKAVRASRGGGVPRSLKPVSKLAEGETPPFWTDLVQPGPKGFPARTHQRREDRGQVVHLNPLPAVVPARPRLQGGPVRLGLGRIGRHRAKGAQVPGARAGMAAYRAHQPQPVRQRDDTPRLSVLQRRLRRAGRTGASQ